MRDLLRVAGLDLAAKEDRCSGYAVIEVTNNREYRLLKLTCLFSDDDILRTVKFDLIKLIAIDAPITSNPVMRDVDRELIRRGYRVFPPSFKWMRRLSIRAFKLFQALTANGIDVIETHPRSALLSSGLNSVIDLLNILGIESGEEFQDKLQTPDLRDAVIAAIVALCYLIGCSEAVRGSDGCVYILRNLRDITCPP